MEGLRASPGPCPQGVDNPVGENQASRQAAACCGLGGLEGRVSWEHPMVGAALNSRLGVGHTPKDFLEEVISQPTPEAGYKLAGLGVPGRGNSIYRDWKMRELGHFRN